MPSEALTTLKHACEHEDGSAAAPRSSSLGDISREVTKPDVLQELDEEMLEELRLDETTSGSEGGGGAQDADRNANPNTDNGSPPVRGPYVAHNDADKTPTLAKRKARREGDPVQIANPAVHLAPERHATRTNSFTGPLLVSALFIGSVSMTAFFLLNPKHPARAAPLPPLAALTPTEVALAATAPVLPEQAPPDIDDLLLQASESDRAEAERIYRAVLAREPHHAEASAGLAQLLAAEHHSAEAVMLAERAVEAAPSVPGYRVLLGDLLTARREYERAARAYEGALVVAPHYGRARRHLRRLPAWAIDSVDNNEDTE